MTTSILVGPGAIGLTFAAALVDAGHDIVVGSRQPFDQLIVTHPDGEVLAPVRCPADPAGMPSADLVLLATKAHQTEGAAGWLAAAAAPGSAVLVLQNGIEHVERVTPLVGDGVDVVPAMVACPSMRSEPGVATVNGPARLDVPDTDAGRRVAAAFDGTFAQVRPVPDWHSSAWAKLILNSSGAAVATITRRDNRVILDPEAAEIALALMREALAVARADGADLPDDLPERTLERSQGFAGRHMASIIVDRLAGRPTEWQARNEVVVRKAAEHGIDAPTHRLVTTLLRLGEPPTDD